MTTTNTVLGKVAAALLLVAVLAGGDGASCRRFETEPVRMTEVF